MHRDIQFPKKKTNLFCLCFLSHFLINHNRYSIIITLTDYSTVTKMSNDDGDDDNDNN